MPSLILHSNDGDGEFAPPVELPFREPFPTGTGLAVGPAGPSGAAGVSVPQGEALSTWLGEGTTWLGRVEEHLFNPATWVGGVADGLLVGGEGFVSRFQYANSMTPFEVWRDSSVRGDHGAAALAIGDLDGDGLLDFAAAGRDELTIFLGEADGFTKSVALQLGGTPDHLLIAEFTGDAHLDVLLSGDETVRLAQGDNGNFALRPEYVPAVPPLDLTALRTGGGTPATAVAIPHNVYSMFYEPILGVALLRFGEDGQIAEEMPLAGDLAVQRLVAVDLDDDGADEPLLFARRDGLPVLTRLTPVDGGFAPGPEHDVSALSGVPPDKFGYARLAAGDPDGDGVPEAWLGAFFERTLRFFELENESPTVIVDTEAIPATHFRDIDGDGHLDAVAVDTNSFEYQRGRGDGTFDAWDAGYLFPGGDAIALAPGPGAQFDLVSPSGKAVSTHRLHHASRPLRKEDIFYFHGRATEFVTADIDQDGHTDVVTLCRDWGGGVQVLWGDPTGALPRADGFNDNDNRGLAVGDLDGDGFPEVIASNAISWIEAYRFWPDREEVWLGLPLDTLLQIEDLSIADVDADGRPDIVALANNEFYDNPGMRLYVAHGEGLFDFGDWTRALSLPGVKKATVEVGDVDGEGHLDFLVLPADDTSARALVLATGARTWAEPLMLSGQAAAFTAPDDDGRVDLVIHDGSTIARHIDGQPDQREVLVRDPALVSSLLRRVADVDGDGRHDLLVETLTGTDVWLHGDAGHRPVLTITRDVMEAIDVADIDGDHRPDLVGLREGYVVVRLAGPS